MIFKCLLLELIIVFRKILSFRGVSRISFIRGICPLIYKIIAYGPSICIIRGICTTCPTPGHASACHVLQIVNKNYDFILCAGDDVTDENMFTSLPGHTRTIKVGRKKTEAKYYIEDIEHVKALLSTLATI